MQLSTAMFNFILRDGFTKNFLVESKNRQGNKILLLKTYANKDDIEKYEAADR